METIIDSRNDNQSVLENATVSISSLVLSIGIMVSYGYVASLLDPNILLDFTFWNPIAIIAVLMNMCIIGLIAYNAHINFKLRNLFLKVSIDNVEILYLMCLPALIVVIITSFLSSILYIITYKCYSFGTAILSFSMSVYFVSVLILLIETNGLIEYGENWKLNFVNYSTILLTITSLLGYTTLNFCTEQTHIFISNIDVHFNNCTFNDSFIEKINLVWIYFQPFMWKSTVLFGITCSIFLINPLLRHHNHLRTSRTNNHYKSINENETVRHGISLKSMLLIIFYSVLLLASTILVKVMSEKEYQYIYQSFTIITYILLIISSGVILFSVKSWQDLYGKPRTFNDILIWMTYCGISLHCLSMIVTCINQILYRRDILYYAIILLKYILLAIQITLQNLLEKTLLNKNWNQQSMIHKLPVLPLLFILGLCNGILALSNFMHSGKPFITPSSGQFFMVFFVLGLDNLGEIFGTLQRLHGSALFMYVFILIKKESISL